MFSIYVAVFSIHKKKSVVRTFFENNLAHFIALAFVKKIPSNL